MAANDDQGTEIRRQNHTTPTVVAVVIVAVVALLVVRDPGGSFDSDPVTTTRPISQQSSTTNAEPGTNGSSTSVPPADDGSGAPPIRAIAASTTEQYVLRSRPQSLVTQETSGLRLPAGDVVATEELVAVLGVDGSVLAGGDGPAFREVACCFTGLTASNEPRHVWAHDDERAVLIDLRTRASVTELALDGQRVLGVASFGLVTADGPGAFWRRPGFEPTPVVVPEGREAMTAGGEVVLYRSGTDLVEARRLTDGALLRSFDVPASSPASAPIEATISTVGDAVALTRDGATLVLSVETGERLGDLSPRDGSVVAIGDRRFATLVDGAVRDSTGRNFEVFYVTSVWLATRAE